MRRENGNPLTSEEAQERLHAALEKVNLASRRVDGVPQWVITGPDHAGLIAILSAANAVRIRYRTQLVSIEETKPSGGPIQ